MILIFCLLKPCNIFGDSPKEWGGKYMGIWVPPIFIQTVPLPFDFYIRFPSKILFGWGWGGWEFKGKRIWKSLAWKNSQSFICEKDTWGISLLLRLYSSNLANGSDDASLMLPEINIPHLYSSLRSSLGPPSSAKCPDPCRSKISHPQYLQAAF